MKIEPANPRANAQKILSEIEKAKLQGIELIAFPEMAVPGYLIGDRFEDDAFLRECEHWNGVIRDASQGLTVVWGSVKVEFDRLSEGSGRARKHNAVFIAANGKYVSNGPFEGFMPKTLQPNYREFDDTRHFSRPAKLPKKNPNP